MKLVLLLIVLTTFVSKPACAQNCPRCQDQIDELKRRVNLLEIKVAVMQGWRPGSATDSTKTFDDLKLIPEYAVVTLLGWDWHDGKNTYGFNPTSSVIVSQNSTAIIELPEQDEKDQKVIDAKSAGHYVAAPCRISVTLSNKTLKYKTVKGCSVQDSKSSPSFNVMFTFSSRE